MIRILHGADLHLDSPFQGLGREKALARREEQRSLLRRIGELAVERQADVLLLAGDLFDSDNPFSETARQIEQVLSGLPMPVFIAPGNHDPYTPRSAWSRLSFGENVHVFTSGAMECVAIPEKKLRVWGSAFTDRYCTPPLVDFSAEKEPGLLDLMVIHGEVDNPASPYGAITVDQLAASGMDYVALGHIHGGSGLRRAGDTFYAWPGCPEGRGFDETGEKGLLLLELEPGVCRAEFVPLGGRRYEWIKVDITNKDDALAAVLAALPEDTGRDIYRICLTGETDAAPNMGQLHRALEERFFSLELRDETSLRRDIWAGQGEDSLKGLFLSGLARMMEAAADDRERERITQAVRWGLQAMENGEELPL